MTVPMGDRRRNTVVAETLEEFLGIGCYVGWFSLEQIVYSPEQAMNYFASPDDEAWPESEDLLRSVREALNLRHVPLSLQRLNELAEKYHPLIFAKEHPTASDY